MKRLTLDLLIVALFLFIAFLPCRTRASEVLSVVLGFLAGVSAVAALMRYAGVIS